MRPKSRHVTWYFQKNPTCSSEKSHQPMFRLQKGLEGPSHVSLAWNKRACRKCLLKNPMSLNVTGVDIPFEKKSSVNGVISSDQGFMFPCMPSRRHFWRTLQLQWFFLEAVPRKGEGRLVRKGPQSCLGQEMKADIRSGARFLKPWAPGLPCTDPRFHRSMQQLVLLWCICESLDPILVLGRNHCTGLSIATAITHCELLVLSILILVSIEDDKEPLAFSSSWQNLQLATRNVASILKP